MKNTQFILGGLLLSFLFLSCQSSEKGETKEEMKVEELRLEESKNEPAPPFASIDPVCSMELSELGPDSLVHEGKTYHFCSSVCKGDFEKDPKAYTAKK